MDIETPDELLGRLKLGREECTQRLITTLIVDAPYLRWDMPSTPSERGREFLGRLEEPRYGEIGPWHEPEFIDEFDLPRRHEGEPGCAPDWAASEGDRLWMVDLKTEARSHRADQRVAATRETAQDHLKRAVDAPFADLEDMQRVRVEMRDALLADPETSSVKPWIWRAKSGDQPLTAQGADVGYELRVSWYR